MGTSPRLFCILFLFVCGCVQRLPGFSKVPPGGIELSNTPFFAQKEHQCGPASLAMILQASGVDTDPDRLSPQIFLPEKQGALQLELAGAVRRHGRIPYIIEPEPEALIIQIKEGRPVLILQDLGAGPVSRYHYAVFIGILQGKRVVLRSGAEKRLVMDEGSFVRTWQRAGAWGLVALKPGEIPGDADPGRYLKAVSALEGLGQWQVAEEGYRAALARWPGQQAALFGLGNVLLARKEYDAAESLFQKILDQQPDNPAALNNLAEALLGQGRLAEAGAAIDQALAARPLPPELARVLQQTRQEILAVSGK